MKKFISLLSVLTLCAAVPVNSYALTTDQEVAAILENFECHDYNADGKVDYQDAWMIMELYSELCTNDDVCINEDKTYELNEPEKVILTEDEIIRIIENGNVTNPDWLPPTDETKKFDGINAVDASVLLYAISQYYAPGDANLDGTIDSLDASCVLYAYSVAQIGLPDKDDGTFSQKFVEADLCGDYNGDGAINALDASEIMADYAAAQTA